jgi:pyruvate/2-oxoglutarate dehydrogenase complex dihydrolipoamide dehydrogenase (E3) component
MSRRFDALVIGVGPSAEMAVTRFSEQGLLTALV